MRRRRPNTNREWRASHLPGLRRPSWADLKDDDPSLISAFFHLRLSTADRVYHFVLMPVPPGPRFGCTSEESGGPSRPLPSSSAQEENARAKRARSIAGRQAGLFFIGIRYGSILELLTASGLMMLTSFLILRQPSSP